MRMDVSRVEIQGGECADDDMGILGEEIGELLCGLARSVMCCGRFPTIRMDEAIDCEDEESLGHPRNQVYAIIDDAENARRAAKELNSIGIEPLNIGLLIGKEDAIKLDTATGEHGFLAKVARIGLELGDRDTDYLAYYHRALEIGTGKNLGVLTEIQPLWFAGA